MSTEAARSARELQMLEGMVDCAHALAMAFGAAAKGGAGAGLSLDHLEAFQKCSLAVRMGIRLCMALRAAKPARAASIERPEALQYDRAERDPPEHEARERADAPERERDRDYDPVSLPKFLATLGVVAREAARLDDRLPADAKRVLPALQTFLAQAKQNPSAAEPILAPTGGVAVLARPSPGRTRDRLLGSAAVSPGPGTRPGLRGPPPRSGFG
jgi:hypothetical protein